MAFKHCIDNVTRARAFYLSRVKRLSVRKVADLCGISTASVVRISKANRSAPSRLRSSSKRGRKFKLSERQRRHLIRCLRVLRKRDGTFTCKRLMEEAGIKESDVSTRTVTRYLNSAGYFYLQTRKKGLMTEDDHKNSCKETSVWMFGKKKLRSTWTEHPSHIREILLIKLKHLKDEYGEKKRGPCSWIHYEGSKGGNWGQSVKAYSRYIL